MLDLAAALDAAHRILNSEPAFWPELCDSDSTIA